MACQDLPNTLLSGSTPVTKPRLLDSGCGCGAMVPSPCSGGNGGTLCIYLLDGSNVEHPTNTWFFSSTDELTYHIKVTSGQAGPWMLLLSVLMGAGVSIVPTSATAFTVTVATSTAPSATVLMTAIPASQSANYTAGLAVTSISRQIPYTVTADNRATIIASIANDNACQPAA